MHYDALGARYGSNPETVICKADLALYSAKQDGKARYQLCEDKKQEKKLQCSFFFV